MTVSFSSATRIPSCPRIHAPSFSLSHSATGLAVQHRVQESMRCLHDTYAAYMQHHAEITHLLSVFSQHDAATAAKLGKH